MRILAAAAAEDGRLDLTPVSTRVNSNRSEGAALIEPLAEDKPSPRRKRPAGRGSCSSGTSGACDRGSGSLGGEGWQGRIPGTGRTV